MYNKTITLNNGVSVPMLALGTWFIDNRDAAGTVSKAVEIGYRHFDTAQAYGNDYPKKIIILTFNVNCTFTKS